MVYTAPQLPKLSENGQKRKSPYLYFDVKEYGTALNGESFPLYPGSDLLFLTVLTQFWELWGGVHHCYGPNLTENRLRGSREPEST